MKRAVILAVLAIEAAAGAYAAALAPRAVQLRCEFEAEPVGVDTPSPRLSWIGLDANRGSRQTAYQLQIAFSRTGFTRAQPYLFDSDKVSSPASMLAYGGTSRLRSNHDYYWRVRLWDERGNAGPWSAIAHFEVGLLNGSDWLGAKWIAGRDESDWRARWIQQKQQEHAKYANAYMTPVTTSAHMDLWHLLDSVNPRYDPAPILRKSFNLRKGVSAAHLYLSGVGYAATSLSGSPLGDAVLDPGWTNYQERVLYRTFDVTSRVKTGANVLGVMLGRGFYGMLSNDRWGFSKHAPWIDQPALKALLVVDYSDGTQETVVTDSSWKVTSGPILYDDPWLGEVYDAEQEHLGWTSASYDDSSWQSAYAVAGPAGQLSSQLMPPIRAQETISARSLNQVAPGVWMLDMGINLAGWMRLSLTGPKGSRILVQMAEKPDGSFIDQTTGNYQQFGYLLKGEGTEVAESHFAYMGFRYVKITASSVGPPVLLRRAVGVLVHTDLKPVGTFQTSNTLLKNIDTVWLRTQLNNVYSIPTDCPHREKLGWLADAYTVQPASMFSFNATSFYENFAHDVSETQDAHGLLSTIAPSFGYTEGDSPLWASADVLIPWRLYQFNGDRRILETQFPSIASFLDATLENNSIPGRPYIIGDVLGDWDSPGHENPPEGNEPYSTAYYYYDLEIAAQMADLLGDASRSAEFRKRAGLVRDAFNRAFYDKNQHIYHGLKETEYRQSVNAVALWLKLVPNSDKDIVFQNLCRDVERRDGHLNTGIIGTKPLLEVLTDGGRADLAYRVINQRTYPGWGYMLAEGATTMWESWSGKDSLDHPMQGTIIEYFYRYLAGIRQDDAHPGFEEFEIAPVFPQGLNAVNASYMSNRGRIVSDWTKTANTLTLHIEIPFNSKAVVTIPVPVDESCSVQESGMAIWSKSVNSQTPGLREIKSSSAGLRITLGSGVYNFKELCQ